MGGFEPLLQAVKQQQQAMAELEEQNRELKRQLAELREGRGMYLDINGQRFALNVDELLAASSDSLPVSAVAIEPLVDVPTTPLSEYQPVPELEKAEKETEGEEEKVAQAVDPQKTPFLEEIMLKEFEAQTTSPVSVWNGPVKEKAQEPINEEQKATLRRELSGSYILE